MTEKKPDLSGPFCRAHDGHIEVVNKGNTIAVTAGPLTTAPNAGVVATADAQFYQYENAGSSIPTASVSAELKVDTRPGVNTCTVDPPGALNSFTVPFRGGPTR